MFIFNGDRTKKIDELINIHLNSVKQCQNLLIQFIKDVYENGISENTEEKFFEIDKKESKADQDRRDIIDKMVNGVLLPDSKREILKIIDYVDRVANDSEEISRRIFLQQLELPIEFKESIYKILEIEKDQFEKLEELINSIFLNLNNYEYNHNIITEIDKMESDIDDIEYEIVKALYRNQEYELAKKIQIHEIITAIADISDLIENISDLIEILLISRRV